MNCAHERVRAVMKKRSTSGRAFVETICLKARFVDKDRIVEIVRNRTSGSFV
jgi:hypothetical protein